MRESEIRERREDLAHSYRTGGRGCNKFGCYGTARRSGLCAHHDPDATDEDRRVADRAMGIGVRRPFRRRFL